MPYSADGFYEWKRTARSKQPYCFALADDSVFAFAGLWDCWQASDGNTIETCSVVTTTANALTGEVHDRMPVIIRRDDYDVWLDPGFKDVNSLSELLKPYEARAMKKFPVSARVNDVANDDAECGEPIEIQETAVQSSLFA